MKAAKDQHGGDMGFNGMNNTSPAAGTTKYASNHYTGHSNDGRLVNKGRGPTVGNKGTSAAVRPPARA
tara:strand:+ start:72 stop:275 length:204 start_codon:yes stop_codon:yes gene_type:complete